MAQDISGFGLVVNLVASVTFPVGLPITQFADDSDPLDMASIQIADTAMGLNGDLLMWPRAVPVPMVLNVVPNGEDDRNLQLLADNNRVAQGKASAGDRITATIVYQDGTTVTLTGGIITNYNPANSVSSQGRLKTKSYTFAFEQKSGI